MFQFGYERRGVLSAGLLAVDTLAHPLVASALADDGHKFTDKFTIYTNANQQLSEELRENVGPHGIYVDDRRIRKLSSHESKEGINIDFDHGPGVLEGFLVHRPSTSCVSPLVKELGLVTTPTGIIEVTQPFCQTSVSGIFAAGDCASMMQSIPYAIAMGAHAGCGIARELPRRVTGNKSS